MMKEAISDLKNGDLAPMLAMGYDLDRLERAALFHVYGNTLYYDEGDLFSFNGERVVFLDTVKKAERVMVTGGSLPASVLLLTEAETLVVGDRAELSHRTLDGTSVKVEGRGRYATEEGAILDTSLGKSLVAGQPLAEAICVPDVAACKQGALLPCRNLVRLELPFVGSGPVAAGDLFHGELGYLFSDGGNYAIPATLTEVKIRGGVLVSTAFYACRQIESVDACGVPRGNIERDAFAGLESLRYLHTPREDVTLQGNFSARKAPCGCTIYERRG